MNDTMHPPSQCHMHHPEFAAAFYTLRQILGTATFAEAKRACETLVIAADAFALLRTLTQLVEAHRPCLPYDLVKAAKDAEALLAKIGEPNHA